MKLINAFLDTWLVQSLYSLNLNIYHFTVNINAQPGLCQTWFKNRFCHGTTYEPHHEKKLRACAKKKTHTDQFHGNREADKSLCFHYKDRLDLMFMKHYAPNRCLYIKVAKLRTGVGSAETSYLQNCSVKLFKEHFKVQICKER